MNGPKNLIVSEPEPGLTEESDSWELDIIARLIRDRGYRQIALQLPDALLPSAIRITSQIRECLSLDPDDVSTRVFVLAGSLHSSCCVDEVAAAHFQADIIIHYGHACFSKKWNTAVHFVLGPSPPLDVPIIAARLAASVDAPDTTGQCNPILVLYSLDYYQAIRKLQSCNHSNMQELLKRGLVQFARPALSSSSDNLDFSTSGQDSHRYVNGLEWPSDISASRCVWIGRKNEGGGSVNGELQLLSLLVQLRGEIVELAQVPTESIAESEVDFSSPRAARPLEFVKPEDSYPFLRRRAGVVSRARTAIESGGQIGVLIEPDGYKSDRNVHKLSSLVDKISEYHPIKRILLSVGRPNAAKLGNFVLDVTVFVLAGCQEAAGQFIMSDDAREVPTPVLLIAEAMQILSALADSNVFYSSSKEEEQDSTVDSSAQALALRQSSDISSVRKDLAGTLSRTWHGLSYEVDEDNPVAIHEGRSGRAATYDREGN